MLEMAKNKFVQPNSLLVWWLLAGFKKASNCREKIGVTKCLGCFSGKLIRDIEENI